MQLKQAGKKTIKNLQVELQISVIFCCGRIRPDVALRYLIFMDIGEECDKDKVLL